MKHLLLVCFMMLFAGGIGAQQMPCPFVYPDTPVNQARGVVGCTLQCDEKLVCPGQQPTGAQKVSPAPPSSPSPGQPAKPAKPAVVGGACSDGKHWNATGRTCVACAAGASWDARRSVCSCGAGKFVDPKTQRCVSCPQDWGWDKGICVCTRSLKATLAGKSCSRPVCAAGSSWDAAGKHCVAETLRKPKS